MSASTRAMCSLVFPLVPPCLCSRTGSPRTVLVLGAPSMFSVGVNGRVEPQSTRAVCLTMILLRLHHPYQGPAGDNPEIQEL